MSRWITLSLIGLALIALVMTASRLGSQNGYDTLDASMVQEGVVLTNNHIKEKVRIVRVEDVAEDGASMRKVVVFTILSGPGAEVLKGEQRWEIEDFRRHYHLGEKWLGG